MDSAVLWFKWADHPPKGATVDQRRIHVTSLCKRWGMDPDTLEVQGVGVSADSSGHSTNLPAVLELLWSCKPHLGTSAEHPIPVDGMAAGGQADTELRKLRRDVAKLVANRAIKRSKTGSGTLSLVPTEDVEAGNLWEHKVLNAQVPCSVVSVDDLLDAERPMLADVRWLLLLLDQSLKEEVAQLIDMRLKRPVGRHQDLEVPYHPIVLAIYQGAASGQKGVAFAREDFAVGDSSRQDIRGMILVDEDWRALEPTEVKVKDAPSTSSDPLGLKGNSAAVGKVYKSCKVKYLTGRRGTVVSLATFASRCEAIWFIQLTWEPGSTTSSASSSRRTTDSSESAGTSVQQWQLVSCKVAPKFPAANIHPAGMLVTNLGALGGLEDVAGSMGLGEFLLWGNLDDCAPPAGFRWLVRYVDTLARRHAQPIAPLQLRLSSGHCLDLTAACVVSHGHKSLVLRASSSSDFVIKIGSAASISSEVVMHGHADAQQCAALRPLWQGHHGTVEGAGDGLKFLCLDGFYEGCPMPTTSEAVLTNFFEQASAGLAALHKANVLHRDIKPSNMLVLGSKLVLNDFGESCLATASVWERAGTVGAEAYMAPRLESGQVPYEARDDWVSLCLAFADLCGVLEADKRQSLQSVLQCPYAPNTLKDCIRKQLTP